MCSEFLWKGTITVHNSARVAWDTITLSKYEGGSGMRDLISWNTTCTMKLVWILFFRPDSIWASWYRREFLDGNINNYWIINTKRKNNQSWFSNKLLRMRDIIYPWIKVSGW